MRCANTPSRDQSEKNLIRQGRKNYESGGGGDKEKKNIEEICFVARELEFLGFCALLACTVRGHKLERECCRRRLPSIASFPEKRTRRRKWTKNLPTC